MTDVEKDPGLLKRIANRTSSEILPQGSLRRGIFYLGLSALSALGIVNYSIEKGKEASMEVATHAAEQFRGQATFVIDEAQRRADETGQNWIVTFKQENTDQLKGELTRLGDNTQTIVQLFPDTTTTTTAPETKADSDQQAAGLLPADITPTTVAGQP